MVHSGDDLRMTIHYGRRRRTVVDLEGELDIASCSRVGGVLQALVGDSGRLVLDLRALRFVDLPSVRMLADSAALAALRDCPFELEGATGQVARLLELTSARDLLPAPAA